MEKPEFITLMEFSTLGEADVFKSLLESAGIRSVIQNEILAQTLPFVVPNIKLVVAGEDEEKAREILSAEFDMDQFREDTHTTRRKKAAGGKTVAVKKNSKKAVQCAAVGEQAENCAVKNAVDSAKNRPVRKKTEV